jgi:hypothetical protein
VGGEGGVKEVTSVMRVVEFGFWFNWSRRPTMLLVLLYPSMGQRQIVKRVDGQGSHERCQQSDVRI